MYNKTDIDIKWALFCTLSLLAECRAQQGPGVAFLQDDSGSIGALDFQRLREFVRNQVVSFTGKDAKVGLC